MSDRTTRGVIQTNELFEPGEPVEARGRISRHSTSSHWTAKVQVAHNAGRWDGKGSTEFGWAFASSEQDEYASASTRVQRAVRLRLPLVRS